MRIIKNGAAHTETLPLPCWRDDHGVLQYDSEFADGLIIEAYGDDTTKYTTDINTLELFYQTTKNTQYRIAQIEYESFFTDIKGTLAEEEFVDVYDGVGDEDEGVEDYEIYSLILYHFNNRSIKSRFIDSRTNKLTGKSSKEYFMAIMKKIRENNEQEE
jgi:hypothetical protein